MLTRIQKNTLFIIFCFSIFAALGLEIYAIIRLINGEELAERIAGGLIGAGVIAGSVPIFLKLMNTTFLRTNGRLAKSIHRLATERKQLLAEAAKGDQKQLDVKNRLITNTLKTGEEALNGWVEGTHFELSVFVNPGKPEMVAYFDSTHSRFARSMAARKGDPEYFLKKGYEAVKLLQNPSSQPVIISDTASTASKYTFATNQQKSQIRSTILLCCEISEPIVLVVTSDAKGAFSPSDEELIFFIRFLGENILQDWRPTDASSTGQALVTDQSLVLDAEDETQLKKISDSVE
jgi:hypothetical protein